MSVSIFDVAQKAGVSQSTVSKVLNDSAHCRATQETRQHIRTIATELGYRPNAIARSLSRRRTDNIGLMVSGLRNPFFVSLLETAEMLGMKAGYRVLTACAPSIDGTFGTHDQLLGWPVDGLLIWASEEQRASDFVGSRARQLPVVYLGYLRTGDEDCVYFDLLDAACQVTEHILSTGRTRICYLSAWPGHVHGPVYDAIKRTCHAAGVSSRFATLLQTNESRANAFETGLAISRISPHDRPDAYICQNDVIALGLLNGLKRGGVRVPEDVAVAGFDGIEEGRYEVTPLTTVECPVDQFCAAAIEVLQSNLTNISNRPEPRKICIPTRLIVGATT